MTVFLFILLMQFLPSNDTHHNPVQTCTAVGLKLPMTVLTKDQAVAMSIEKWGTSAWTYYRGPTVMVGFRITTQQGNWLAPIEPDPKNCPSLNCWKNTSGSWRGAWNSMLIYECRRRQAP